MPQPVDMNQVTRAELVGLQSNLTPSQRGPGSAAFTLGLGGGQGKTGGRKWDLTRGGIGLDDLRDAVEGKEREVALKQLARIERDLKTIERRAAKNKRGLSAKKAAERDKIIKRAKNIQDGINKIEKEVARRTTPKKPKPKAG